VPGTDITAYRDERDPLWRLVPAHFNLNICLGRLHVLVESNDPWLLGTLANMDMEKSSNAEPTFLWRVIRDPEAGGEIEPATVLEDGDLSFLRMGWGVFAGVDKERRELLGFVGTSVSEQVFRDFVVRAFVELTLHAANSGARIAPSGLELALVRGKGNV
jgi:hypothetical protein